MSEAAHSKIFSSPQCQILTFSAAITVFWKVAFIVSLFSSPECQILSDMQCGHNRILDWGFHSCIIPP